jgi:hypothetical protein
MFNVKTLLADFVYLIQILIYLKLDLLHKNYMTELMAQINGKQYADSHERPISTFIIRISDSINFVINNG